MNIGLVEKIYLNEKYEYFFCLIDFQGIHCHKTIPLNKRLNIQERGNLWNVIAKEFALCISTNPRFFQLELFESRVDALTKKYWNYGNTNLNTIINKETKLNNNLKEFNLHNIQKDQYNLSTPRFGGKGIKPKSNYEDINTPPKEFPSNIEKEIDSINHEMKSFGLNYFERETDFSMNAPRSRRLNDPNNSNLSSNNLSTPVQLTCNQQIPNKISIVDATRNNPPNNLVSYKENNLQKFDQGQLNCREIHHQKRNIIGILESSNGSNSWKSSNSKELSFESSPSVNLRPKNALEIVNLKNQNKTQSTKEVCLFSDEEIMKKLDSLLNNFYELSSNSKKLDKKTFQEMKLLFNKSVITNYFLPDSLNNFQIRKELKENISMLETFENDYFRCPITKNKFLDPVIAGDGHTYERKAISKWVRKRSISPITRQPISSNTFQTNFIVKNQIKYMPIVRKLIELGKEF